jgi:hypothetical protein
MLKNSLLASHQLRTSSFSASHASMASTMICSTSSGGRIALGCWKGARAGEDERLQGSTRSLY